MLEPGYYFNIDQRCLIVYFGDKMRFFNVEDADFDQLKQFNCDSYEKLNWLQGAWVGYHQYMTHFDKSNNVNYTKPYLDIELPQKLPSIYKTDNEDIIYKIKMSENDISVAKLLKTEAKRAKYHKYNYFLPIASFGFWEQLKNFQSPDFIFDVYIRNEGKLELQLGDWIEYESEWLTLDDLLTWAKDFGILDDCTDENGDVDYDYIRNRMNSYEDENPGHQLNGATRAVNAFNNQLPWDCFQSDSVTVYEGGYPGGNVFGVTVTSINALLELQNQMYKCGYKLNFEFVYQKV